MSKRGVPVLIDGQPKIFRFNLNAIAELEGVLGGPVFATKREDIGFRYHRAFVWAGLLHAEPKLTLTQVGDMLDPVMEDALTWGSLLEACFKALDMAFPDPKPKDEGGDPNAQSATSGVTSSS